MGRRNTKMVLYSNCSCFVLISQKVFVAELVSTFTMRSRSMCWRPLLLVCALKHRDLNKICDITSQNMQLLVEEAFNTHQRYKLGIIHISVLSVMSKGARGWFQLDYWLAKSDNLKNGPNPSSISILFWEYEWCTTSFPSQHNSLGNQIKLKLLSYNTFFQLYHWEPELG